MFPRVPPSPSRCPAAAIPSCCSMRSSALAPARDHRLSRAARPSWLVPARGRVAALLRRALRGTQRRVVGARGRRSPHTADESRKRSPAAALRGADRDGGRRWRAVRRVGASPRRPGRDAAAAIVARRRSARARGNERGARRSARRDLPAAVARHCARRNRCVRNCGAVALGRRRKQRADPLSAQCRAAYADARAGRRVSESRGHPRSRGRRIRRRPRCSPTIWRHTTPAACPMASRSIVPRWPRFRCIAHATCCGGFCASRACPRRRRHGWPR